MTTLCVGCKAPAVTVIPNDDAPLCAKCCKEAAKRADEVARRLLGCGEEQCEHEAKR
jgi:hypothetical protein